MFTDDDLSPVLENVDLLFAESREVKARGPHLRIHHRFRAAGSRCLPGEEVAAIYLLYRRGEIWIPLPLTLRLLVDFLGRHRHLPQSAIQIALAIQKTEFYRQHGRNASSSAKLSRQISPSCVKQYVSLTRRALAQAFRQAHLQIDAESVLLSEPTVTNQVGYRLRAIVEWSHADGPDGGQ